MSEGPPGGEGRRPRILLEGRPGVGKTTVVRRLADLLRTAGIPLAGFTTEEIREEGTRVGFSIESLAGERAVLAHIGLPGSPRVGRYGVDVEALERVALPALRDPPADGVVVVDELGKMELASPAFGRAFLVAVEGPAALVATVHAHHHPYTDALKSRSDLELVRVAMRNREELPGLLAERLTAALRD